MKEILSSGEKIRRLRTNIGLKQEDITDEVISKSLVSMLEQGKRGLTQQTAEIIAECLNRYYKKLGKEITAEYLLETEEEQIRKEILKNIEHLAKAIKYNNTDEALVHNTFDMAMELIEKGNFTEELIELKILKGNFYYNDYQYKDAVAEYLDALDHCGRVQNYGQIARVFILLGRTYQMQMMIDNAVVHYSKAYDTAIANDTPNKELIKAQSLFNQILCYRKMKRYGLVISHINYFKDLKWQEEQFRDYLNQVKLIEANTFRDIENWDRAIELYNKLLEDEANLEAETLFLVYENYAVLHRNKGDFTLAIEYIQKAFGVKDNVELNYIPALYLYQATCYNLEEEYDKVITLLESGLRLAEMVSKKQIVIEFRFAFVEIYLQLQKFDKALQQLQIVEESIDRSVSKPLLYDLYSFYIQVYNGLEDGEKCKEYAIKIRQRNYLRD